VAFLSRLLEAGVDVRFADLPQIEGATGRFMLQQMVAVAELEAGMISHRTKMALAQAKKRGTKLGRDRGVVPSKRGLAPRPQQRSRSASTRAQPTSPQQSPACRLRGQRHCAPFAAALNGLEISTARGGEWDQTQVRRILARLKG
jgi:DNA invertase Pin-like site-specific DNA recombinase